MLGMVPPFVGDTNVGRPNGITQSVARPIVFAHMDAPARLRALPSWLLSEAARRGHVLVTEGFAEEGVRKPHFTVLVALAQLGPASQAELGRRLWIDRKNMVAVINDLEAAGLVERTPDAQRPPPQRGPPDAAGRSRPRAPQRPRRRRPGRIARGPVRGRAPRAGAVAGAGYFT